MRNKWGGGRCNKNFAKMKTLGSHALNDPRRKIVPRYTSFAIEDDISRSGVFGWLGNWLGMILQLLLRFELLGGGGAGKVCGW